MVDTGSQVTTITAECFRRSFPQSALNKINWLTLSAANSTDIPYSCHQDDPSSKVSSPTIGMNVLRQLPAETLTTIIGSVSHTQAKVTIGRRDILGIVRVAGEEKVRVPAQSALVLRALLIQP